MQNIKDILAAAKESLATKGKISGPNSERVEVIVNLVSFMGEDRPHPGETAEQTKTRVYTRIKYWLGRTRKYTPAEIYGLIKQAKDGHTPPKLFNWLLKKENEKRKANTK